MTDEQKIVELSTLVHAAYHAGWRARRERYKRGPGDDTDVRIKSWNNSETRERLQSIREDTPCE